MTCLRVVRTNVFWVILSVLHNVQTVGHVPCELTSCDQLCYAEFSKDDANTFLSSGKRSTPRDCCQESYCEVHRSDCATEQYRSYIANQVTSSKGFTCPPGQIIMVTNMCYAHYNYHCVGICQAVTRCENGGTCVPNGQSYTCSCSPGYSGTICAIDIDECSSNPCNSNTTVQCSNSVNNYVCQCRPGYTGKNCETDINECLFNLCQNSLMCTDMVNDYICTCRPGFTGKNCDTDIDECLSSPCQNNATCYNQVNRYVCHCPPRIYGVNCDTHICQPTPADVVFILDSSVSMTEDQFRRQLEFVANFSKHVTIGPRDFQIAVITFSFKAHVEFYLNTYISNTTLNEAIMNITFKPGATFTHYGLQAVKLVISAGRGIERRINNTAASRFVYLLTDGLSTDRRATREAAKEIQNYVDTIAAIGIGDDISHQELTDIASNSSYVYSVQNFNSLYTVLKQLVHYSCDECVHSAASEVAFLIDTASDITLTQFHSNIQAAGYIIDLLHLSENDSHVSMTTFDECVIPIVNFTNSFDRNDLMSKLNKIVAKSTYSIHSKIYMSSVFAYVRTHMFASARPNAKMFLVIFTNGNISIPNQESFKNEKTAVVNTGVNIIAVGGGNGVILEGLVTLVTDTFNVFQISNVPLNNLDVLRSMFVYDTCDLKTI